MTSSAPSGRALGARFALLLLAALPGALPAQPLAQAQREPGLQEVVQKAIETAPCFANKFDSAVWFSLQEPRLRALVADNDERMQILATAFCEANRPDEQRLPPGLIMAVMDVESRFNRWAVSSAGAVGLMQVMPFWPDRLGMQRFDLTQVTANMRMGCAILRYYLKQSHNDWRKTLGLYNGSLGSSKYYDLVVTRWTTRWNGADDLGAGKAVKR